MLHVQPLHASISCVPITSLGTLPYTTLQTVTGPMNVPPFLCFSVRHKDDLKLLLIFCLYLPNARSKGILPSLVQICFSFSVALSGFSFVLKTPRATHQLLNRDLVSNAVSDAATPSCLAKWMNLVFLFFDPPFKTKFPNHVSSQLLHAHSVTKA